MFFLQGGFNVLFVGQLSGAVKVLLKETEQLKAGSGKQGITQREIKPNS